MNLMNLVRWQQKGYIIKIRNGWYCFTGSKSNGNIPWLAANLIFKPSYISLNSALSYYDLIPEAVYTTTSITTKKTNNFNTTLGNYTYNHVKPEIFSFGQTLIDFDTTPVHPDTGTYRKGRKILLAEPEKAILDFFYINSNYNTEKDIEHLRLDGTILNEMLKEKFYTYLEKYKNRALEDRIFRMIKVYTR
ncbi:MAG: hypothetical protein ISS19_09085 [Bacteroidales bacterium]|nr:hypothetical protein [Bacteroidales bacterium]